MRICVLEEDAVIEELLSAMIGLRHHQSTTCQTPLAFLEALQFSMRCSPKQKFELLIIGDHPHTSFSWRSVIEQVRTIIPDLPIVLISNISYHEVLSIEHQFRRLRILDEPFRLQDFYTTIEGFGL